MKVYSGKSTESQTITPRTTNMNNKISEKVIKLPSMIYTRLPCSLHILHRFHALVVNIFRIRGIISQLKRFHIIVLSLSSFELSQQYSRPNYKLFFCTLLKTPLYRWDSNWSPPATSTRVPRLQHCTTSGAFHNCFTGHTKFYKFLIRVLEILESS